MLSTFTCFIIFPVLSAIIPEAACTRAITNISHVFLKNDFHYLNVIKTRTFAVTDVFDCTLQCLRLPLCVSVNMASNRGSDGKFWCELLSSDKYINSLEFKGNETSHHLFKKSHCIFTPCQNGGTCMANYKDNTFKCLCEEGFLGEYCETGATSCKQLYEAHNLLTTQLVTLRFGVTPTSVFCHMGDFGCGDGAWTTVMKIDGNKNTFHFDSPYWGDMNEYNLNGGETGFDTQETKLKTYWNTPFSKICLGMKINQQLKFVVINKQANSLYSLIADGNYRSTSLGRSTWKTLLGSQASLQSYCNKEGFNLRCGNSCKARIGVVSNNENNCDSCDSRIGFGTAGHPDDSNTCGNAAKYQTDNGDKYIKAMGYILVQ